MRLLAPAVLIVTALAAPNVAAQAAGEAAALEARVWLDRGEEPVLRRGETVRIYYRASENAYAAIFRIDTDGRIELIYPQDPTMVERLTGGVDYRMIFPNSPIWRVSEDPGVGYFFMVASPDPLDFSAFPFDPERGWDLSGVGELVYEDPYLAIDDYVARLIPDWEQAPYALDFITYHVGDTYTYPRFLCYDCHDARPYASWNPYSVPCTTYRVVIYDDPYFYPYYRYSGVSVVVARPLVTQPRYAFATRAPGDGYRPIIRTRTAPPRRTTAEYKEGAQDRPVGLGPDALTPQRRPSGRPTLQRRPTGPSSRLPVRTPPSASDRGTPVAPNRVPDATIVRPSPRSAPSTSPDARQPSRPSERVTPTRRGTATPSTRPTTSPRPGTGNTTRSQPGTRSATPGRPTVRPAPRPTTRSPAAPRSAAPRSAAPRSAAPRSAAPRSAAPSRPSPTRTSTPRPSAGSRPSSGPSARSSPPSRSSGPPRPSVSPRSGNAPRR